MRTFNSKKRDTESLTPREFLNRMKKDPTIGRGATVETGRLGSGFGRIRVQRKKSIYEADLA